MPPETLVHIGDRVEWGPPDVPLGSGEVRYFTSDGTRAFVKCSERFFGTSEHLRGNSVFYEIPVSALRLSSDTDNMEENNGHDLQVP